MESPSQPHQPAASDSSSNKNHDACTTKGWCGTPKKYQPRQQAVDLQRKIRDTIMANGLEPQTLSSLSRVWLDLEHFKRTLGKGSRRASSTPAPAASPAPAAPPSEPSEAP